MAYATADDVQTLIPDVPFDGASMPTSVEVVAWLSQVEAMINGVLSAQGYATVPATGTNDVLMLRGVVAQRVAAMAWLAAYNADEAPAKVSLWNSEFKEFMNRLRQGQQYLVDQQPQGDSEPVFLIVRQPSRDDYFTERAEQDDWDE